MSFTDLKNNGGIIARQNPRGNTYWWFKRGRGVNYETKCIYDKDGYDRWGNEFKVGGWQGKKFRKKMKRI